MIKSHVGIFRRTLLGLAAAVGLLFAGVTSAFAQGGAGAFADMNRHDYLHRDIVLFAQALDMDEGQRVILESLYEDYRSWFDAGWEKTRQRLNDMREELASADRDQVISLVLQPLEDWLREKLQLKDQFEQNVKVILNPMQLERWGAFERQMLREKTLHAGRLSGESLNLFHVLRELRLSERMMMQIDPTIERYDNALHEALVARNAALQEEQRAVIRSMRHQEVSSAAVARVREQVKRRIAVRNVNDLFIEEIAAVLPEQYAEQFRQEALQRAYPRAFRPLPAQRVFDAALQLDLEEEKLSQIAALREAMLEEFAVINVRLHQGIREHEPKAMINQAEMAEARQAGEPVDRLLDPNLEHIRHRDERAHYYMTQLRDLLGLEQFAGLPGSSRWVPQRQAEAADHNAGRIQPRDARQRREARGQGMSGRDNRGTRGRDGSGSTGVGASPSEAPTRGRSDSLLPH